MKLCQRILVIEFVRPSSANYLFRPVSHSIRHNTDADLEAEMARRNLTIVPMDHFAAAHLFD